MFIYWFWLKNAKIKKCKNNSKIAYYICVFAIFVVLLWCKISTFY